MLNKLNIYILKKFFFTFLITFITFAIILFIGDFVEQFRKAAGKQIPVNIILQLAALNFPNLISFSIPLITFAASMASFLILIKGSEKIIINSSGVSNFKLVLPAIVLYLTIGIVFVIVANPLIAIFDEKYSELDYKYIDRVDKFASITKNGLWLKQDNPSTNISSVLYAMNIQEQGKRIDNFMILEYDQNGIFQGRLDGTTAKLNDGFWEMQNTQITPRFGKTSFRDNLSYHTNIKPKDITDSLSSPGSISIWRLLTFINFLESLGYSALDFKLHFYELIFLPIFMASLVVLSSSLILKLKQNDKFTKTSVYSLLLIFIIYFLSNLLNALGTTAQITPVIAKSILPFSIFFVSIFIYQIENIKSYFKK